MGYPLSRKGPHIYIVTNPCMGGVAVAVGMCVCMCVVGVRVDKEATGLGRKGERRMLERDKWNVDESADSCCCRPGRRK